MSSVLLQRAGKHQGLFLFVILFCMISGCGKENSVSQHYNPSSPLPLRVEAVATPIAFPEAANSQEEPAAPASEALPEEDPATAEPTYSPVPTGTPDPGEMPATPVPSPTVVPTATPTIMPTFTPEVNDSQTQLSMAPVPLRIESAENTGSTSEPDNVVTPAQETHSEPELSAADPESEEEEGHTLEESESRDLSESEKASIAKEPIITPYDLTIEELRVCSQLAGRTPSGCADTFSLARTGKIFTWMKVSDTKPPKVIKHVYYWEQKKVATVHLTLKYSAMRTWSQKTFRPDQNGIWKVVIMTEDDNIIATRTWLMTP